MVHSSRGAEEFEGITPDDVEREAFCECFRASREQETNSKACFLSFSFANCVSSPRSSVCPHALEASTKLFMDSTRAEGMGRYVRSFAHAFVQDSPVIRILGSEFCAGAL